MRQKNTMKLMSLCPENKKHKIYHTCYKRCAAYQHRLTYTWRHKRIHIVWTWMRSYSINLNMYHNPLQTKTTFQTYPPCLRRQRHDVFIKRTEAVTFSDDSLSEEGPLWRASRFSFKATRCIFYSALLHIIDTSITHNDSIFLWQRCLSFSHEALKRILHA